MFCQRHGSICESDWYPDQQNLKLRVILLKNDWLQYNSSIKLKTADKQKRGEFSVTFLCRSQIQNQFFKMKRQRLCKIKSCGRC